MPITFGPYEVVSAVGVASIKAAIILVFAFCATRALRRSTAAVRHAVWTVAIGACAALLPLGSTLPAWRVIPASRFFEIGRRQLSESEPVGERPVVAPRVENVSMAGSPAMQPALASAAAPRAAAPHVASAPHAAARQTETPIGHPTQPRVDKYLLILVLWFVGVVVMLGRFASSAIELRRLGRSSDANPALQELVDAMSRRMRINRTIRLRSSHEVELPVTWGVLRPTILFPADTSEWTAQCRAHVLKHELAHIKRFDAATQLLSHLASALFWFHPLMWYAVLEIRRERERACDDVVLVSGANGAEYASDLLGLVLNRGQRAQPVAALAFARRSSIEGRLLALLDPSVRRGALSLSRVIAVVVVATAMVTPLAAARTVAVRAQLPRPATLPVESPTIAAAPAIASVSAVAGPTRPAIAQSPSSAPSVTVAPGATQTLVTPAAPEAQPTMGDVFDACEQRRMNHNSDRSDDGSGTIEWTASGESRDCQFSLDSKGAVTFTPDATGIAAISPGGYFTVTTNIKGAKTGLSVRPVGATLTYEFFENDQPVSFEPAGAAWLARFLIGLDRTTGFAIDLRFPALVRSGGAMAVVAEAERTHGDYAEALYLSRLAQSVELDVNALRRIGALLGTNHMGHQVAEITGAIASRYKLTDDVVRAELVHAAVAEPIDHERGSMLLSILSSATLAPDEIGAVLTAVSALRVDFEKVRVLTAIAETQRLDGDLRAAYVNAASTIRDKRQQERATAALPQ